MTTISPPTTWSQLETDLGYAAVFAEQRIMMAVAEKLNALELGLVRFWGDLARQGSDTLNITHVDGLGWAAEFTAMASETQAITPSSWTTGKDTLTIARHGLGYEESYQARIIGREPEVFLESLVTKVPASFYRTLMSKLCTAGASVSTSVGTSGAAWTFDDELDLINSFKLTEGFDPEDGDIITVRHPEQYEDLRESMRHEPAFQDSEFIQRLYGIAAPSEGMGSLGRFLNLIHVPTFRITQSGGDHIGFAYQAGAFGYGVASTGELLTEDPGQTMYMPDIGLIIQRKTSSKQAKSDLYANLWFGVDQVDEDVRPAKKIVSVDD